MKRLLSNLFLALITFALLSCAAHMGPMTIKTAYTPTREHVAALPSCAAVSQIMVTDGRTDRTLIGHRYFERRPEEKFPVTSDDSVVGTVKTGLESLLKQGNLLLKPGRPELKIAVTAVDVDEKASHLADYDGRVAVDLSLVQPGSAQPCWKGAFQGNGSNSGRAASAVNYDETIARALDNLVDNIVKDAGFREAVCGGCGGAAPSAQSELRMGNRR